MTMGRDPDLLEFQALIAQRLGLWFDEYRREFLAGVLRDRAAARGCAEPAAYLRMLAGSGWSDEWPALSVLLTITETYFFRGQDHFRAFKDTVLTRHRQEKSGRLRLLSAGCASGEEAYSLAIAIKEYAPWLEDWQVNIFGADTNREMLAKARQGRYSAWSLRETPPEIREKYFRPVRQDFVLDEKILAMVTFEERNLAQPNDDLWRSGAFDAVFCRNMMMYFVPETAAALVARIQGALAPGGFLFLGHAETLRGLSQAFHLRRSDGAFFYQLRDEREARSVPPAPTTTAVASLAASPLADSAVESASATWFDEISRASARIALLSAAAAKSPSPASSPVHAFSSPPVVRAASAGGGMEPVLDLHQQGRYADALAHLQDLPAGAAPDADRQLLRAVLLVNCGRLREAEALCRPLLGDDELNTGAHYVAALCREHAGDLAAAEEHDETAAYLDPLFAMPRFHLGLMHKRQGRKREARGHFQEALALLVKDDPARLLLFGGGFTRETFVQACRSEILQLGGAR